ncbi:MAG: RNA pseudouridine synthase [Puniceicoccales bacterium]|jgi:23S rRNA pseudouridine955/2504/2580 synthase|nr:RNA pseudouridine synthase [Puniceicoccales bacterium]
MSAAVSTVSADATGAAFSRLAPFLGRGVRVAAADAHGLLALEKPAGVASHPNAGGRAPAGGVLLDAPYSRENECYMLPAVPAGGGAGGRLFLLNRIDSPTSGLVLACADGALAAAVKQLFREHAGAVRKTYLAVVRGVAEGRRGGEWRDRLAVGRGADGGVRTRVAAGGVPAVAEFEFLAVNRAVAVGAVSLLRLSPVTGRTHQLRVQCASRRHAIAGDATYGDFAFNRRFAKEVAGVVAGGGCAGAGGAGDRLDFRRMFLHAWRVEVRYSHGGRQCVFAAEAPPPAEFVALFPAVLSR